MKRIQRIKDLQEITEGELIQTPQGNKGIFLGRDRDDWNKEVIRVVEFFSQSGDLAVTRYSEGKNGLDMSGLEPDTPVNKYWDYFTK